jgi:hypothetical protein
MFIAKSALQKIIGMALCHSTHTMLEQSSALESQRFTYCSSRANVACVALDDAKIQAATRATTHLSFAWPKPAMAYTCAPAEHGTAQCPFSDYADQLEPCAIVIPAMPL